MKKFLKWVLIAFVGLIALGMIIEATKSPEQKAAEAAQRQEQEAQQAAQKAQEEQQAIAALPEVTADQIARAYAENTVAADQQFKGKQFKVSGVVTDINTDIMGDPYVTLRGGDNQFMEPHFGFDKSSQDALAKLKKGDKVTLVCTGRGDVAKTPMSDSCSMM